MVDARMGAHMGAHMGIDMGAHMRAHMRAHMGGENGLPSPTAKLVFFSNVDRMMCMYKMIRALWGLF